MNHKRLLGILVKFPKPGVVKTRLAKDIGFDNAAMIYKFISEKLIVNTYPSGSEYERIIFYSPADKKQQFEKIAALAENADSLPWDAAN